jgi:ribose-phosphate pyrophosphokinase
MRPVLLALEAADDLCQRVADRLKAERGEIELRRFPDGESYVRLASGVEGRDVVLLCSLDRPDAKALPLLFAADAARAQGARSVGLAAPYLAYMRQDKAFRPGEAVTSLTFARLLSGAFDWLVTLDPHLHRYSSLASLYAIPAAAASAARPIADWIGSNVVRPMLIGPDEESAQWVGRIARLAGAPSAVLRKERTGDFDVSVSAERLEIPGGSTPVLVDDIASSARTMVEAVRLLRGRGHPRPWCVAVHAIFAGDAYQTLLAAEPVGIVSTNSVEHPSNRIDASEPLAEAVAEAIAASSSGRRPSSRRETEAG